MAANAGSLFGQPTFDLPSEVQFSISGTGAAKATDVLFDGISKIRLGKIGTSTTNLGLTIGRTIYDNHDVLQSYTVVDTVALPVTLYSYSLPIGNTFFSLALGLGGNLTFLDLRQVTEGSFRKLDPIKTRDKQITATPWYKMATSNSTPPFSQAPDQPAHSIFGLDSANDALYSNLWNMVSFPARLPFKAAWVKRLDIGEVIAYGASGLAEFGPSVGVLVNPGALSGYVDSLNVSAGYRVFISGDFHIAVQREDDNHVRVKIVRTKQYGQHYGTSAASNNARLFDGFVVLGAKLEPSVSVIPFNFQNLNDKTSDFEEGFRFDLRDPAAQAAYEQAAIGKFAAAEALVAQTKSNPVPAVTKLFQKDEQGTTNQQDRGLKILIYSEDRASEVDNNEEVLQLPDGEHTVLESVADNTFHSQFLLGGSTRLVSRTTIDYTDRLLSLILEGWMEDQVTDGNELRDYESSIEKIVDRGQLFMHMPIMNPSPPPAPSEGEDEDSEHVSSMPADQPTLAYYGNSSFYFRMDVNQANAEKFFQTSEEDKWKTLERVFQIPEGLWQNIDSRMALRGFNYLGRAVNIALIPFDIRIKQIESLIIADSIYNNWIQLANISDPKELTHTLVNQFADPVYGFEMMQVFTNAIGGQNLPFYLSAANKSFGRISVQEGELSGIPSLEEYRRTANFDEPDTIGQNENLALTDLNMKILDADHVQISFHAQELPQYLYFRVDQLGMFINSKAELVVMNMNLAKVGANTIVLNRNSDGYDGVLAKAILALAPNPYRLSVALGAEKTDWGPVATVDGGTK